MKLLLLIALAWTLAAQDASKVTVDNGDSRQSEVAKLQARIAELEKQLALQGVIANDFSTQAINCNIQFTVYKARNPEPPKEQAK